MAKWSPDVKFLGSIFPGELPAIRRHYGPSRESNGLGTQRSTLFKLEPVPRGKKPFVLPLYDSFQDTLDVMGLSSHGNTIQKPRLPKPVPCEEIVADLLKEWTGGLYNVPQGAMPGIIEIVPIRSDMKRFQDTNGAELPTVGIHEQKQMEAQQMMYFEWLFMEGERFHKQNDWKSITATMRLAAEYLVYEREWSSQAIARASSPCLWCQAMILDAAIVCSACGRQVRETPANLAKFAQTGAPPAA